MFKNALIFIMLALCFSPAIAQTIEITISTARKITVSLDGKNIANEKVNSFSPATSGLKIKLTDKSGAGKFKIALVDNPENGADTFKEIDLTKFFQERTAMVTEQDYSIKIDGTLLNLNRSFSLNIGLTDKAEGVVASFAPMAKLPVKITQNIEAVTPQLAPITVINKGPEKKSPPYKPGSAVYDALRLAQADSIKEEDLKLIATYYFPNNSPSIINGEIALQALQSNPFLKGVNVPIIKTKGAYGGTTSSPSLSLSSIGGMDVTSLADGIAKFLVKRAKEELSIAFFQKLDSAIQHQPDLKTLFPKTTDLLGSLGDEVYNYREYIQNLREAFKKDIDVLDTNLPGIIKNHEAFFNDDANKPLAAAIIGGSYLTKSLRKQTHPGDILANYPFDHLDGNIKASVQTVQLISQSMRDTSSSDSTYWVDVKYLRQLTANKNAFKIYLGLVYQEALNDYPDITFHNTTGTKLTALLKDFGDNHYADYFDSYHDYVTQFGEKVTALNKLIKSHQKPANDSLAVEVYKQYFDASADLFEHVIKITDLKGANACIPNDFKDKAIHYLNILQSVSDLAVDLNRKNYPAAINQTLAILTKLKVKNIVVTQAEIDKAYKNFKGIETSKVEEKAKALATYYDLKNSGAFMKNLARYGSFMAAIATAKNSDQVEATIEAFAMPVGSSSVKRESPFNVSLNAYTGLFAGHESISGLTNQGINSFGVTAPIGAAISWGQQSFFFGKGHSSHSIFISLIDVGALAAYRFNDYQTDQVPKVELKDIFSPGLFLSWGIAKTPLSFNIGVQTGPNLRKVNAAATGDPTADFAGKIYWRYSASLVVDIPLLNFYTKSK